MDITLERMISILSDLPDEAKKLPVKHICGAVDGPDRKPVFQITLSKENGQEAYVLVPKHLGDTVYDTFGERRLTR